MAARVSYLAVARLQDKAILSSNFSSNISSRERSEIENAFFDFLQKDGPNMVPGGRKEKTVSALGGKLYLLADNRGVCVFTACINDISYPETAIWKLIDEFSQMILANTTDIDIAPVESLSRNYRRQMKDLMAKYDTPASVDKTAQVRQKIGEVEGVMQENVRKILDTQTDLKGLEDKTDSMSRQANQFLKQSVDLRRQMQLRNLRMKIILGVIIMIVIVMLGFGIFKGTDKK